MGEQLLNFNYLACDISCEGEKDINKEIIIFTQILVLAWHSEQVAFG